MKQIGEFQLNELLHPETPLAKHYAKKLLIPGWAGELTDIELKFIKDKLRANPTLRQAWGFIHSRGFRISDRAIRERAT